MYSNFIELGATPFEESTVQVGDDDYTMRSRHECRVFRSMLERLFLIPDGVDARFVVKSFPHDFGRYREVCLEHDFGHNETVSFVAHVEANIPFNWDDKAKNELLTGKAQIKFVDGTPVGEDYAKHLVAAVNEAALADVTEADEAELLRELRRVT